MGHTTSKETIIKEAMKVPVDSDDSDESEGCRMPSAAFVSARYMPQPPRESPSPSSPTAASRGGTEPEWEMVEYSSTLPDSGATLRSQCQELLRNALRQYRKKARKRLSHESNVWGILEPLLQNAARIIQRDVLRGSPTNARADHAAPSSPPDGSVRLPRRGASCCCEQEAVVHHVLVQYIAQCNTSPLRSHQFHLTHVLEPLLLLQLPCTLLDATFQKGDAIAVAGEGAGATVEADGGDDDDDDDGREAGCRQLAGEFTEEYLQVVSWKLSDRENIDCFLIPRLYALTQRVLHCGAVPAVARRGMAGVVHTFAQHCTSFTSHSATTKKYLPGLVTSFIHILLQVGVLGESSQHVDDFTDMP